MTRRVLFVDDEPQALEGLRHQLQPYRGKWEMVFVESGSQALAVLARDPVDVVVTDMHMPAMDGAALLQKTQELYPGAARIMLTAPSERDAAIRASPAVHQFLTKPCDPGVIENAIERVCDLRAHVSDAPVRQLVGRIGHLPPSPLVYSRLVLALAKDTTTIEEVAGILKQDMALCAKTLQLVNSAFFGLRRTVSEIEDAVAYLGFNTIKQVALAVEVFQSASARAKSKLSLGALRLHALLVGRISSQLLLDGPHREEAFVAGLLHDVGKVVLSVELPDHVGQVLLEMQRRGCSMYEAEQSVWGVTHAEVGGYLLGLWGLPYSIVEAVAHHHQPSRVDTHEFGLLAATHVADALLNEVADPGWAGNVGGGSSLDAGFAASVGITERLPEWTTAARELVATESAAGW